MRHRALLLALVGILCLWASWAPGVRPAALLAAAINVVGFLGFYALYGNPAGALRTIAIADLVALPPLAFAAWMTLAAQLAAKVFKDSATASIRCLSPTRPAAPPAERISTM